MSVLLRICRRDGREVPALSVDASGRTVLYDLARGGGLYQPDQPTDPGSPMQPVAARQSDRLVESIGVNVHTGGAYASATAVADAVAYLGVRHVRIGRVGTGDTAQRALAMALVGRGVRLLGIADDYAAPTPDDRVQEILSQWGGGAAQDGIEALNEPQRFYGTPATWPATVSTNGPSSTDSAIGVAEARRQQQATFEAARAAAPTLPVLLTSMATKDKFSNPDVSPPVQGWYDRLGDVSTWVDVANLHIYPGGQTPLKGGAIARYLAELPTSAGAGRPTWITETGYHDFLATTSGHKATLPAAAATYLARMPFELAELVRRFYVYELLDEPSKADLEAHFGLFTDPTSPKPAAVALARVTALFSDPGAAFLPPPLPYTVTGGTDVRSALFARRDGTWLVAL